jgi:hypothetical protein
LIVVSINLSQIFGDFLEFVDRAAPLLRQRADNVLKAMIEVILDQRPLRLNDRLLDRMQLLSDVAARPSSFDHFDDAF